MARGHSGEAIEHPTSRPSRGLLVPLLLAVGIASTTAEATQLEYALDLPANQIVRYQLEIPVYHPGGLSLDVRWSDTRVLAFKLVRPDGVTVKRSGPPPLSWSVEVDPDHASLEKPWNLSIRGLPAREAATGSLIIELPESPAVVERERAEAVEAAPPPVPSTPWRDPLPTPRGRNAAWSRVYESSEQFRALVVADTARDEYRWHDEMLRFLAHGRAKLEAGDELPSSTREMLLRMAEVVDQVEALRTSDDPLIAGPGPSDKRHRETWEQVRRSRLLSLEDDLDGVLHDLESGHAPELDADGWSARFVACLLASQRHFEARVRVGEERAGGLELVRQQWQPILAAAEALESLASLR